MSVVTAKDYITAASPTLSVGLLAADLSALGNEVARIEKSAAGLLHFDVMDGCFCPALTAGPPLITSITTRLLKDVHLMITDPLPKLDAYAAAGADMITLHLESSPDLLPALKKLSGMTNRNQPDRGILRGIALNPDTLLEDLSPLLDMVDMVMILAVKPGLSGQTFDPGTPARLAAIRKIIEASGKSILIGLDGGITRDNLGQAAALGADVVVAGSAVFKDGDPVRNIDDMIGVLKHGK